MAMPAVQISRPVPATTVKNTFIDLPATPSGGHAYVLASAPARGAPTVKESLAAAAAGMMEEQPAFGSSPNRPKPQALSAISEAPAHFPVVQGVPVVTTVTPQVSGMHSIPATPAAMNWDMATPTGTPMGASRQTLSLQSMIQSPKAEERAMILGGAYQQVYQPTYAAQPITTVAPPQYVAQVPSATAPTMVQYHAPLHTAPPPAQAPQLVTYQAVPQPPAPPMAAPMTAAFRGGPPTIEVPPPGEAEAQMTTASPLAAVKLGLVAPGGPPRSVPTYTSPVRAQMPTAMYSFQAPVSQLPPATFGGTIQAAGQIVYTTQPQGGSVSSPQKFVPPPPLAPAPTVLATPKGYMPMPRTPTGMPAGAAVMFAAPPATTVQPMAPPGPSAPPLAPPQVMQAPSSPPGGGWGSGWQAPAQVQQAPSSPGTGMSAADLKVLLDMAVASGNQQAIDMLLRQAQAAGLSPEALGVSMHPPK